MTEEIYFKRQENLKNVLSEHDLDGLLITNLTNIRYICGFTGSAGTCLVTQVGQYFITDGRYIEQSKDQVKGFDEHRVLPANQYSHVNDLCFVGSFFSNSRLFVLVRQ